MVQNNTGALRAPLLTLGAGNETRTRDPNLGKVVLCQLSYSRALSHSIARDELQQLTWFIAARPVF